MSKHAYISLIRFEWKCFIGHRILQVIIYILLLSAISISMTQPLIFKTFIDNIQNTVSLHQHIYKFFTFSFCIKIIEWLLFIPAYYLQRKISFIIYQEYISSAYCSLYTENQLYLKTEKHTGNELSRLRKSCDGCRDYFNDQFHYIEVLFRLILSIVAISCFSVFLGILAVLLGVLAFYLTILLDKRYSISQKKLLDKEHIVFSFFADLLRNLSTIVSLNLFQPIDSVLRRRVLLTKEHYYKSNTITITKLVSVDVILIFMTIILIIGFIIKNSSLPSNQYLGSLVALFSYISIYTGLFKEFTWINTLATDTDVNIKSFIVCFDRKVDTHEHENSRHWNSVKIQNIRPDEKLSREVPALNNNNVNLKLNRGEHVLIMGSSGSGKSTILEILAGILPPAKETKFYYDDNTISPQEFSKQIIYSPQDTLLFNDTVLFNIVLGCAYNEQDIQKIIKVTGLDVVLKAKSNRLDSIISENGNNLSGGQKQRILLSRYLFFTHLKKCPILILDESMSALDRVSENIILHNIFEAYPDLSIIMVSHNNLLKGKFDKIIDLK